MLPTVLFDSSSIESRSLTNFTIDTQVTVAAIGLPAGASVTFEMIMISSPNYEAICPGSCEIPAVVLPSETAWQKLLCCGGAPVTLNTLNPVIVLDVPQHMRIRAIMAGYDFNSTLFTGQVIVYPSASQTNASTNCGCCA